jgi:hypothetical protein
VCISLCALVVFYCSLLNSTLLSVYLLVCLSVYQWGHLHCFQIGMLRTKLLWIPKCVNLCVGLFLFATKLFFKIAVQFWVPISNVLKFHLLHIFSYLACQYIWVLVFYCCATIYHSLSDLKQHPCIIKFTVAQLGSLQGIMGWNQGVTQFKFCVGSSGEESAFKLFQVVGRSHLLALLAFACQLGS